MHAQPLSTIQQNTGVAESCVVHEALAQGPYKVTASVDASTHTPYVALNVGAVQKQRYTIDFANF